MERERERVRQRERRAIRGCKKREKAGEKAKKEETLTVCSLFYFMMSLFIERRRIIVTMAVRKIVIRTELISENHWTFVRGIDPRI